VHKHAHAFAPTPLILHFCTTFTLVNECYIQFCNILLIVLHIFNSLPSPCTLILLCHQCKPLRSEQFRYTGLSRHILAVICLLLQTEVGIKSLEKLYKIFTLKSSNNSGFSLSNSSFLSHYSPFFMPPTFHSILIYLSSGK
jgi:hypothetical protein